MNPKAKRSKSKARLANYDKLMADGGKEEIQQLEIPIPNGQRLRNEVIEAVNVAKGFGDRLLYENLNFKLPHAGIVGIVGPNGAGKTTLFKMIMGEETPDSGDFKVGSTVELGYVDQAHEDLDEEQTVFEVVAVGNDQMDIGGKIINSRAYLSRFNFNVVDHNNKV